MISQKNEPRSQFITLSNAIISIGLETTHLFNFEDVLAIILFRLDGRVLKSHYNTDVSNSVLSILKWISDIISKSKVEIQRGAKSIKYDKQVSGNKSIPVYFYRAGYSSILVAILNERANTGLMEIEMSRTAKRLGLIIDTKKPLGEEL
jgi:predicted regulator of Ras-like GTPase activity (Roadblock/LC7/MglB family)